MRPALGRPAGVLVAGAAGFLALSCELLWYRAYSIALMARPQAFGVVLGGYLLGVGCGALMAARWCAPADAPDRLRRQLAWAFVAAGISAFLLLPVFGWLVTVSRSWAGATLLIAVAALALGAVFPLVIQGAVRSDRLVGERTAAVYFANIVGATAGAVITGFYLMEHIGMARLSVGLSLTGLGMALLIGLPSSRRRGADDAPPGRSGMLIGTVAGVMTAVCLSAPLAFDHLHERLFFRTAYASSPRFTEIVENRAGVIGVTADGAVYGGGVYDGVYNTTLRQSERNQIQRAYALGALHRSPRRVLLVGLGSGSWATVIADHPQVERLVIVEINPGYVGLLAGHAEVSHLASHPKVAIEIADGRRWLQQRPAEQFDVIVANTVYHWRANATSLLSVEFLELVRSHLAPGGVYYFNSTGEARVQKTAAAVFPHAWRLANMMIVGDAPIEPDVDRMRAQLDTYQIRGLPVLDMTRDEDRQALDNIVAGTRAGLETRASILARTSHLDPITDDNMGTEWQLPPRYRLGD